MVRQVDASLGGQIVGFTLRFQAVCKISENGRTCDCYAFLFNDMFVLTKNKKYTKIKVSSYLNLNFN